VTHETQLEVLREVLTRRAVERSLLTEGADEAATTTAIEALLDREAPTPEPTDEECSRYYAKHLEEFTSGDLVFARHILFAIVPGAPVDAIRSKAEETLERVSEQPESFAGFARTLSNCPSGQHDGNLGQLARGECVPEFEQALFAGKGTGLVPGLVRTRFGFHIVAVDRRLPGQSVPFEAVRERIADHLRARVQRKAFEQYLRILAAETGLALPGVEPATSPLVR
jgi:peptidyl-prolyl cis-trans isomerase C